MKGLTIENRSLHCGIVLGVGEEVCEITTGVGSVAVRFAAVFPSPRRERVSPGHLVAITAAPNGSEAVIWRWYDAVILGGDNAGNVRLWEPAHGEVVAKSRNELSRTPGTRAYLSAGLPGADWWVAGAVVASAAEADVELAELQRFFTDHDLWSAL